MSPTKLLSLGLLRTVLGVIGFTAVIAQIVLMRELMVVFCGNELFLGLMLATWLVWTALGSTVVGKLVPRIENTGRCMASLQVLLAIIFPATILAVRSARGVFRAIPGEILGPEHMFLTCLIVLSCFCALSGGLFVAGSQLYAHESRSSASVATGSVYLFEAAGSALGGIIASLFLLRYLNSIEIALLMSVLNLAAAANVLWLRVSYRLIAITVLLAAFVFVFLISGQLETISLARMWPGFRVVTARNSVHGNLVVVDTKGIRSLFENGLLMFNAPDLAAAEEAVHFGLLEQASPKSLLLIGGGASGSLLQALQHPTLQRVDYVELDPVVLDLALQYFPEQWQAAHRDARVHVHHADGRLFLKSTERRFDVILINLPDPQTAQLNRFYTVEFFRETAQHLNTTGILSFQLHAAEEYISPELRDFLRCINKSLREVFPVVSAVPGETVHFFAAKQAGISTSDPQELIARLRSRHLETRYVREYYIPFRMMPDRMQELAEQIQPQPDTPINRDFAPIAYYFDVALWSTQFNAGYRRIFDFIARARFSRIVAALLAVLLVVGTAVRWLFRGATRARMSAAFCIAAGGLTLISLEMLLLLGFQAIYGYVYHQLAIVIAFFMVGMALGSWQGLQRVSLAPDCSSVRRSDMLTLAGVQLLATLSPLILYVCFTLLGGIGKPLALTLVSQVLFPTLALLSGVLGGYEFPLASRIFFTSSSSISGNLGTLYALDLVGACIGALALSAFVLPVFGFFKTAVLIAVVNLVPGLLAGSLAFAKMEPRG